MSTVRLVREGLALGLSRRGDFRIVGTAAPREAALAQLAEHDVSVVLLDVATSSGLITARELNRVLQDGKIIAFGVPESDEDLLACAEAGVAGYVVQDGSIGDLIATIKAALNGEVVCSPRLAALLFRRVNRLSEAGRESFGRPVLTRRESQIANLLAEGLSNKEIAITLRIEAATVKNHVHSILEKFRVRRRGEAGARWRSARGLYYHRAPQHGGHPGTSDGGATAYGVLDPRI